MILMRVPVPRYDGGWLDILWSEDARVSVSEQQGVVRIGANAAGIYALARQMLYFACNDFGVGAHVHYEERLFPKGWSGCPLVLVRLCQPDRQIDTEDDEILLRLPSSQDGIPVLAPPACVHTSMDHREILLQGNSDGLFQLGRQLLFVCCGMQSTLSLNSAAYGDVWEGIPFEFVLSGEPMNVP